MKRQEGTIIVLKSKQDGQPYGKIARDGVDKWLNIPDKYEVNYSMKNKKCQFELDNKERVCKVFIDNKEILTKNINTDTYFSRFMLPEDTQRSLSSKNIENYFIKYNKFVPKLTKNNKGIIERPKFDPEFHLQTYFDEFLILQLISRHKELMKSSGAIYQMFHFTLDWHLAIGLGNSSAFEASMALHPLYGFPYLPASSIKGVTLSYVIQTYFNGNEKKALEDEFVKLLFGTQEKIGIISFLDGIPITKPKIKLDVLSSHQQTYYAGQRLPTDYDKVVPVNFPVVYDTSFLLTVMCEKDAVVSKGLLKEKSVMKEAIEIIQRVFSEQGIGSKTSVDYGFGHVDLVVPRSKVLD